MSASAGRNHIASAAVVSNTAPFADAKVRHLVFSMIFLSSFILFSAEYPFKYANDAASVALLHYA